MTEDRNLERNPLEERAPQGVINQMEQFAYDLAWGVDNDYWGLMFSDQNNGLSSSAWLSLADYKKKFRSYIKRKWDESAPTSGVLLVNGYLEEIRFSSMPYKSFCLTDKALNLLKHPPHVPKIFLSYRRSVSSPFTLAIEARLKHKDNQIGVFIDKSLTVGEPWHGELQEQIRQCEYFVCLLGEVNSPNDKGEIVTISSLESPYVLQEIAWAIENDKKIIAIRQPNYQLSPKEKYQIDAALQTELDRRQIDFWSIINRLSDTQAIQVDSESAKHYESAINELINALGYSTI